MEVASVSTNVITKSNISTSTNLLTMSTSWIQLEAHLPLHTASYVWEVMVKANGSTTAYSLDGIPTVTINNPPDCLQQNTVYYLKSTTSSFTSPKIYSFHTTVANADSDVKIDFVVGEMGTGTTFSLIFIRKNYNQNTPNGGSIKLNRFITEPLGEMACCYKDTFENMTEASFYFAPTGETVVLKRNSFTIPVASYYGQPIGYSYGGSSGIYTFALDFVSLTARWIYTYSNGASEVRSATFSFTATELYQGTFSESITYPEFGSGTITFQTPMTIPDVRLYMPDAYLFVATGHHISVGTIETTLIYDTGTGCYVSEVLNYYNIPGRIYFSAPIVPRDFGNEGDWRFVMKYDPNYPSYSFWNDYSYASLEDMRVDFYGQKTGAKTIYEDVNVGLYFSVPIENPRVHMTEPNRTRSDGYGGTVTIRKMIVRDSDGTTTDWALTNQIAALPNGTPLVFVYGPMAISYSYYQRAIKSRFTAFSTFHSTTNTGHPTKGLFRDDLRDSAFWQGADRFVIRSDSNDCYMTSLPPL